MTCKDDNITAAASENSNTTPSLKDKKTEEKSDVETSNASDTSKPTKAKRTADRQITKDDEEENSGDEEGGGTFKRANADTLKKRRILKVGGSRPAATTATAESKKDDSKISVTDDSKPDDPKALKSVFGGAVGGLTFGSTKTSDDSDKAKVNPFAKILSAPPGGGIFGSKISNSSSTGATGFGGAASLFGSAANSGSSGFGSSNASAFGGGGGSSKLFNGFGGAAAAGEDPKAAAFGGGGLFGSKKLDETNTVELSKPPAVVEGLAETPNNSTTAAGEENEDRILQVRCRLYHFVSPATKVENDAEKTGDKVKDEKAPTKDEEAKPKIWKEVGTGPLRFLHNPKTNVYRLVQRRECTPGGNGTKLILNVPIKAGSSHVLKSSEKHVQINLLEVASAGDSKEAKPACERYLFKFRTTEEADEMFNALTKSIKENENGSNKEEEQKEKADSNENATNVGNSKEEKTESNDGNDTTTSSNDDDKKEKEDK